MIGHLKNLYCKKSIHKVCIKFILIGDVEGDSFIIIFKGSFNILCKKLHEIMRASNKIHSSTTPPV